MSQQTNQNVENSWQIGAWHPRKLGPWLSIADRGFTSVVGIYVLDRVVESEKSRFQQIFIDHPVIVWATVLYLAALALTLLYPTMEGLYFACRSIKEHKDVPEELYKIDQSRRERAIQRDGQHLYYWYIAVAVQLAMVFFIWVHFVAFPSVKRGLISPIVSMAAGAIAALFVILLMYLLPWRSAKRNGTSFQSEAGLLFVTGVFGRALPPVGSSERKRFLRRSLIGVGAGLAATFALMALPGVLKVLSLATGTITFLFLLSVWHVAKYER